MDEFIKIGTTFFNKKAVKKMGKTKFLSTYKNLLKGINLEEMYILITGEKSVSKKTKKTD